VCGKCYIPARGYVYGNGADMPFRCPQFQLLESIYQSFDEATFKYGIFKVETIGDCYVAVTGVPDARDDHAVAMTRFAFDCVRRFKKVTKRLEQQLGEGTSALQARVGLHSGPVTGGVIRGQKAR
jgi:class 3 adenylate cyclase